MLKAPSMNFVRLVGISVLVTVAAPAFAQEAPPPEWSGDGNLNAGVTSGNTETSDLGLGVKVQHQGDVG